MSMNDHGFLGKDIDTFRGKIYEEYQGLFEFFKELNHFLQKLKFNLVPSDSEDQQVAIITLYVKALETFQSVYILCSYGLPSDAEVLNRALYETTVKISYCSKGEDNYRRYLATDIRIRIKSINIIKHNPKVYSKEASRVEELDSQKTSFEAMLKEIGNPEKITIEGMAKKSGLGDMYDSFYHVASETVHTSPRSLEDYILIDKDGKTVIVWGPRDKRIGIQLTAAIEFMLFSCQCLSEVFGQPKTEDIVAFNKKKEGIWIKSKERRR